jgi:hypothetical protein
MDVPADDGRMSTTVAPSASSQASTVIWAFVEAAMLYLLVSGAAGRSDRRAGAAAAIVGAESLVFANGARCPLTGLAESLGVDDGSVTDVYLPNWLARSLPCSPFP